MSCRKCQGEGIIYDNELGYINCDCDVRHIKKPKKPKLNKENDSSIRYKSNRRK